MSFLTGDLTLQWPHTVLGHSDLGLAAADAASFATGRLTVHASTSVLLHGWQMFVSFIFQEQFVVDGTLSEFFQDQSAGSFRFQFRRCVKFNVLDVSARLGACEARLC